MKSLRFWLVATFLLFLAVNTSNKSSFSTQEERALNLIKKVKKFEKGLSLSETKNFQELKDGAENQYNLLYFQSKKDIAFSYLDPKMTAIHCPYDNYSDNSPFFSERIPNISDYDLYLVNHDALAGEMPITRKMLRLPTDRLVEVVIHEDFHSNVSLPRHINESAATLVGRVGYWQFLKFDKEKIFRLLDEYEKNMTALNQSYNDLEALVLLYKNGKINYPDYQIKKELIILNLKEKLKNSGLNTDDMSATKISMWHTYVYYFPLIKRVLKSFNGDLKQFILVFRNSSITEPREYINVDDYFQKTRINDRAMEKYLENIIQQNNKHKPE